MPSAWFEPGSCRVVCQERRASRPFKPKDVERIAAYAGRGFPAAEVIGAAFVGVGLGFLVCWAAAHSRQFLDLFVALRRIAGVIGFVNFLVLLNRFLVWLRRLPAPQRFKIVIGLLSALLGALIPAIQRLIDLDETIRQLEKILPVLDDACTWVRTRPGAIVEAFEELVD